ncbi:MAG: NnrS family protein, partial [Nitrosomonadales bacterium]|nr:NnrS family protein [Nitrosomonadales bacterium]
MLSPPIGLPKQKASGMALFNLGFRPFFLGASIFALISMTIWMAIYSHPLPIKFESITAMQWHAHEMIYGYGLAVIAGFLLTAVKNWTGIQTLHGKPLLGLFSIWAIARLLLLGGSPYIMFAALADLLFGLLLMFAVVHPIIKTRQWKQMAVLSKLIL